MMKNNPNRHTFDTTDEVEVLWKIYEKEYDACFTSMVNNAIKEYLTRKLKKK